MNILLDLMPPGRNRLDILEILKEEGQQDGVMIISAKNEFDSKIRRAHAGADDYLVKPLHLPELAARIYPVIRRLIFANQNNVLQPI